MPIRAATKCISRLISPTGGSIRPHPVALSGGPWLGDKAWSRFVQPRFASRGHEVASFGMSYTLEKAKDDEFLISWDFGEELARHIRPQASAIPFPPIIVAQGTAGNVALSYLESHPSAALVLISPGLAFGGAWCPGLSSGKYDDRLWRTKDNVYNIVGQENMPCNDFDSRSGDYFPVGPLLNPAMDPSLSLTSIRIESSRKSKFPMIVLDFVPMTTVSRLAADQLAESVRISEEEYAGKILECEYVAISIDTPVERFEMMRAGAWALDEEVSGVVCDVVDEWLDEHSL